MKVMNKVIVVTGAGGGIGSALVKNLLSKGATVAAVDLNEKALKDLIKTANAGDKLSIYPLNLTNLEEVEALPEKVIKTHGAVDGIINNAGIIHAFVPISELSYEKIKQVMDINFYGTLYMVKSFLPHLLERPEGHIVNISSMGGFLPVPGQSIYGASKAAVKLMTEGLHSELMDTNVHVTMVFPGGVATNITGNSGVDMSKLANGDQASKYKVLKPEEAAIIIIEGMEKNKYRVLAGSDAVMMDRLYRLMPKKAAGIIAKKMKDIM
jgi:short-subunit dehydrogenase